MGKLNPVNRHSKLPKIMICVWIELIDENKYLVNWYYYFKLIIRSEST